MEQSTMTKAEPPDPLVEIWRSIIIGEQKSWLLFKHGTCVILMEPAADLSAQALTLMREWGPVQVGSSAGDFNVLDPVQVPGWVVTSHHKDIMTYIGPDEVGQPNPGDLYVGLFGRQKRNRDAHELEIIHVEDKRAGQGGRE